MIIVNCLPVVSFIRACLKFILRCSKWIIEPVHLPGVTFLDNSYGYSLQIPNQVEDMVP